MVACVPCECIWMYTLKRVGMVSVNPRKLSVAQFMCEEKKEVPSSCLHMMSVSCVQTQCCGNKWRAVWPTAAMEAVKVLTIGHCSCMHTLYSPFATVLLLKPKIQVLIFGKFKVTLRKIAFFNLLDELESCSNFQASSLSCKARQDKFICIAHFCHTATQSALHISKWEHKKQTLF